MAGAFPLPSVLLVLCLSFAPSRADVSTTVYCKNQCSDYLQISDALMPSCTQLQIKANLECGSVISCDPADAKKERIAASSTNASCCYNTVIKTNGDCEAEVYKESSATKSPVITQSCSPAWSYGCLIAIFLFLIVLVESYYIFYLLSQSRSSHQKISNWSGRAPLGADSSAVQPILSATPGAVIQS